MNTSISEDQLNRIREAIFRGGKIQAIKLYRRATNSGLAEAKTAVETLEMALRTVSPEKFTTPPNKGCFGVVVAICAIILVALVCRCAGGFIELRGRVW